MHHKPTQPQFHHKSTKNVFRNESYRGSVHLYPAGHALHTVWSADETWSEGHVVQPVAVEFDILPIEHIVGDMDGTAQ